MYMLSIIYFSVFYELVAILSSNLKSSLIEASIWFDRIVNIRLLELLTPFHFVLKP